MENKSITNIAVMSVGSGVGQSVIMSINNSNLFVRTFGFDINIANYGGLECDELFETLPYSNKNYIKNLLQFSIENKIKIIIPGLDDEALILSESIDKFSKCGIDILVSNFDLLKLVRDKSRMCNVLKEYADIFVESYQKEEALENIAKNKLRYPLIAKPISGSASDGILIINKLEDFDNVRESHIIQELALPKRDDPNYARYIEALENGVNLQVSEVSLQLVANRNGDIIGQFMSMNKLKSGAPVEVIPFENEEIISSISPLIPHLKKMGFRGPLNIQGRMTETGFKVFEMNARFTGITGLRSLFGFNEVEACIRSWLNLELSPLDINYLKFGVRQVENRVGFADSYPYIKKFADSLGVKNKQKNILITGANGYLANVLVDQLKDTNKLYLFSRDKKTIIKKFTNLESVYCFDNKELIEGNFNFGVIDTIIHTAFARPNTQEPDYVSSLDFTNQLFQKAARFQTNKVINISSQSVYGPTIDHFWKENDPVNPDSLYALSKYSAELMLNSIKAISKSTSIVSLRLSRLAGVDQNELIYKTLQKVRNSIPIDVYGGKQLFDILDVRDAASAIVKAVDYNGGLDKVYNLGSENKISLDDLLSTIDAFCYGKYGKSLLVKNRVDSDERSYGLDSSKFREKFDWEQKYSIEESIKIIND